MDEAEVDKSSGIIVKRGFQEILSSCQVVKLSSCSYGLVFPACFENTHCNNSNVIAVLTLQMRGTEGNTVCMYSLCFAWSEVGSRSCDRCC